MKNFFGFAAVMALSVVLCGTVMACGLSGKGGSKGTHGTETTEEADK
jgi:hypothetical protein